MRSILCAVALLIAVATPARADSINAVLGDASWTAAFGDLPAVDETLRIQTHLAYVLDRLSARDVTVLPRATRDRRAAALASLARYTARGVFPERTDDGYPGRRPRFIDARGVHCAVGHLIADSGSPELARAIHATHEYAYVRDIQVPELLAWATATGFTVDELAMIQPSYSSPATPGSMREQIKDAIEPITMRCAAKHPPVAKLALRVVGDEDGAATVTTKSDDPFAKCFAAAASQLERGRGAFDSEPEEYTFTMDVAIPSPQTLLANRFERMDPQVGCMPRPGVLPRTATFDIRTSDEGLVVKVVTTPHSAEVTACLEREYASRLRDFGPGSWKLALHREREVVPLLEARMVKATVASHAPSLATDCATGPNPPTKLTIFVAAKTDDDKLVITVDAKDEAFTGCLIPKLEKSLRDAFTVTREINGTYQRYFRIDTDVRTSATIQVEFPAARDARAKRMREEMERNKYR
jgi:hypothetical protein